MEQSPSWEANMPSASQAIPCTLWNPQGSLQHSIHKRPLTCPYPKPHQSNPCSSIPLLEDSFQYFPPIQVWNFVRSPHQNPVCTPPVSHTRHMPRPSHSSWFEHLNNIRCGLQIMKLLIIVSSQLTCYLDLLRPKYPPQHPILEHPQPTFLPQCERPSFTPTQNNRLNMHLKWRRQKNEY